MVKVTVRMFGPAQVHIVSPKIGGGLPSGSGVFQLY